MNRSLCADDQANEFSLVFEGNTDGSETLVAHKATAIKSLKKSGVAISFGSLFGPTRIVKYNNGIDFLQAAFQSGIDYVIPSANEFIHGKEVFQELAGRTDTPVFLSANLIDEATGRPLVEPYATVDLYGRRICIITMSDAGLIMDADDNQIAGLDIIPYNDALASLSSDIAREHADLVIVAGRMDRESVLEMAERHSYIDIFFTNNQMGGFSDSLGVATNIVASGKPVYICPEASDHLGVFAFSLRNSMESREFRNVTLGDVFPPDPEIASKFTAILDELKQLDFEESVWTKTGGEVADILKKVHKTDAVILDRSSLFYYPLKDSLTVYDIHRVVRPGRLLSIIKIKGAILKTLWRQSTTQKNPMLRLVAAGITTDGKINDIPIQDESDYTITTTTFLRTGGDGYAQFSAGTDEKSVDSEMLDFAKKYLVEKEELLRKLAKPKIWSLSLNISVLSNYNRKDIDVDKAKYGNDIPKTWRAYEDFYQGNFNIKSMNNELSMNKKLGKHLFNSRVRASWSRTVSRTDKQSGIVYDKARNSDPVEMLNKYTYDLPGFPVKPYVDLTFKSFLYSGVGKHPITAITSSGATRTFPSLFSLNVSLGIHGTRDYTTLMNTAGFDLKFDMKKDFPAGKVLKTPVSIETRTRIQWNPAHVYFMAFQHENYNKIKFKIMEKISLDVDIQTFSYRSSKQHKLALGFYYLLSLSYGMNWKF
ncbi:hypothetical protein ACFL47_02525 [Candidatus Latescibacterota bacterium]